MIKKKPDEQKIVTSEFPTNRNAINPHKAIQMCEILNI